MTEDGKMTAEEQAEWMARARYAEASLRKAAKVLRIRVLHGAPVPMEAIEEKCWALWQKDLETRYELEDVMSKLGVK